jgi:hypothetical protein
VGRDHRSKTKFGTGPLLAILVVCGSNAAIALPATSTLELSPRELFARTFARLGAYAIPPYAIYTTRWHVRAYSPLEPPDYDVLWRYAIKTNDGLENAASPQAEEWLPPATITGEYLGLFATILRAPAPAVPTSPDPDSGLKTIAVVAASRENYQIDFVAVENVNGNPTDHLRLTPLRDSSKYNLRDLWIDTQTFDLRKARIVVVRYPGRANWDGSSMTVYFGPALQYWIVMHEAWSASGPHGSHSFDVTTLRVAFPPSLPNWIFDQAAYNQRQRAGAQDILEKILEAAKPPP